MSHTILTSLSLLLTKQHVLEMLPYQYIESFLIFLFVLLHLYNIPLCTLSLFI